MWFTSFGGSFVVGFHTVVYNPFFNSQASFDFKTTFNLKYRQTLAWAQPSTRPLSGHWGGDQTPKESLSISWNKALANGTSNAPRHPRPQSSFLEFWNPKILWSCVHQGIFLSTFVCNGPLDGRFPPASGIRSAIVHETSFRERKGDGHLPPPQPLFDPRFSYGFLKCLKFQSRGSPPRKAQIIYQLEGDEKNAIRLGVQPCTPSVRVCVSAARVSSPPSGGMRTHCSPWWRLDKGGTNVGGWFGIGALDTQNCFCGIAKKNTNHKSNTRWIVIEYHPSSNSDAVCVSLSFILLHIEISFFIYWF